MRTRPLLPPLLTQSIHTNLPRLRQAALVGVVLAASAGLGVLVTQMPSTLDPILILIVAAAPLAVLAVALLAAHQEWMPAAILFLAAFSPLTLPTGTGSRLTDGFLLTIGLTGLWILRMITVERRFWLKPSPLNLPLLIFMGVTIWSIGWSSAFRDPLVNSTFAFLIVQMASGTVNVMLPAAFLMVANFINDERMLKVLVGMMLAAGVAGLAQRFHLVHFSTDIINTDGMYTMWVVNLAAGLALFARRWKWHWRILLAGLAGIYVYWGFVRNIDWLAGWLPAFAALGILLWRHSRKALLGAFIVAAIYGVVKFSSLQAAFAAEDTTSGLTRMAAWEVNWTITKDHLLFGTGPAGYAAYYMTYFPTTAMATHSNYLDILAQNGILGMIPCLAFFFGLAWTGWRLSVRLKGRGDFLEGLANCAFAGTVACIVAMAFGDWLFPFAYTQTIGGFDYAVYSWLFMGTTLVVERLTRPKPGAPAHA